MTRLAIFALACALPLSGCAGGLAGLTAGPAATPSQTVETIKALSQHLGQCDRHYQGGLGLGASFTFTVDCKAVAGAVPPPPI
jgi:hypothetical protein